MTRSRVSAVEATLLALAFLDLFGFGMLIPDVQIRLDEMGSPGWSIGAVLASMFIVQVVVSPLWGRLSDKTGRKPIIILCTLISSSSMLVYALANGPAWILASRILAGLGAANIAIAQAYVTDLAASGSKIAAIGRMGAAISLGLIAGPAVGGWIADRQGNGTLGLVAASASLIGAVCAIAFLPTVKPTPRDEPQRGTLQLLREVPGLSRVFTVVAVAWLSLAMLEGTFGRLIHDNLGYGQQEFGTIFAYESLLSLIVQALLVEHIEKKFKTTIILRASYVAMGVGLFLFPFAPALWALFLASTAYALGSATAQPTANAACSELTPPDRQGELFGLMQGARSFGFIVGPIVGGRLFDWNHASPYVGAMAVCMIAALFVPRGSRLDANTHL